MDTEWFQGVFRNPVSVLSPEPRGSPHDRWDYSFAATALLRYTLRTIGADALVQEALRRRAEFEESMDASECASLVLTPTEPFSPDDSCP